MFSPWCADPALAADLFPDETRMEARTDKGEKSHQGFFGKTALSPGITWSNSTSALGLRSLAVENRVRSRCTGKERDSESGLDYFRARYYGSRLGRFMTPDSGPDPIPYADYENPQTLNLYGYVSNNPLSRDDPDGHKMDCTTDPKTGNIKCTVTSEDRKVLLYPTFVITLAAMYTLQQDLGARNREWLLNHVGPNSTIALLAATFKKRECCNFNKGDKPSPRYGWKGGFKWRAAVKELNQAGDHLDVQEEVPTREEATEMIKEGGGTILRGGAGEPMDPGEEFGHDPAGDSTHTYPHINYETASGARAAVKVQ